MTHKDLNPTAAIDDNRSRLITRFRQRFKPTLSNWITWRVFVDPISFVMERKMLQGIKARAENQTEGGM